MTEREKLKREIHWLGQTIEANGRTLVSVQSAVARFVNRWLVRIRTATNHGLSIRARRQTVRAR